MSALPTVTKLEAAKRQLCTAIRMFFADDDVIAVHTLASAAREIFEKHCPADARFWHFDAFKQGRPGLTDKEVWNLVNGARNFFKHEGASLDDSIVFVEESTDSVLLFACSNCVTLTAPAQPAEADAFITWYMATQAVTGLPEIDNIYPGMRTASRSEQKRFGAQLVADALAGRLAFRFPSGLKAPTGG